MDLLNVYEYKGKAKNITNSDIVVVYGNVYGDITNADNVIIINGDMNGDIRNCENVLGTVSDQGVSAKVLLNLSKTDCSVSRKDTDIMGKPDTYFPG